MSFILLFLILIHPIFGQTPLDPIEVAAEKDIDRFSFTTSESILSREMETQPLGLVTPELEKVPGVIANQNGGPGGRVSFFIRGTESRHVSFTLDGMKINDTSNTDRQFDAAFLTSAFLKKITVYKGPQAVLYGSDAMGGVIELTTKKGENSPETRVNVNAGSFGTIGTSLSKDWGTAGNTGTLTATRFHSDGISRLNEKRYDANEKDATDITHLTTSSRHVWGKNYETDLLGVFTHGKAEQDGFASDSSNDFSQNDHYVIQQKSSFEIQDSQTISLRNAFNRHQRRNESRTLGSEYFGGNLIQHEIIHRLEVGPLGFLTGLSTEEESAQARGFDRTLNLHSLFLQTAYEKNDFQFHGGVRTEQHSRYGTFYTGSLGVGVENFFLQYSQGYKAPSLYQLYGPDLFGAPVGNPDLMPETNHFIEAVWKKNSNFFDAHVAIFQNRLTNLFTITFGQGYVNQQNFISEGVELSGKWRFKKVDVLMSFVHQNFREKESPVLRRPHNTAQVNISWFYSETLEFSLLSRWFSARKDLGETNVVKLNPYEVIDFGVRKTWLKDEVSVQLKNIFNRSYEEIYGFNVLARSLFVNYGHRFE